MANKIRKARQRSRVAREGIFDVFTLEGEERSEEELAALRARDAAARAKSRTNLVPAGKGNEGAISKRRRFLRDDS